MRNLVRIGQAFQRRNFKDNEILYMYTAQVQGQITLRDKHLIVTERICYFDRTL